MTTLFNVTDAVSAASNHGITRTERKLAETLGGLPDVELVAMSGDRLWRVDGPIGPAIVDSAERDQAPEVERLGIDPVPRLGRRSTLGRLTRKARSSWNVRQMPALSRLQPNAGDVLVSVGLDWMHQLLREAERLVLGHGVRYAAFCHDMIPVDHPEWLFPPDPIGFASHYRRVTAIADVVVCNSWHTRSDLLRHYPEFPADRARVITLGADAAVEASAEHHAFAAGLFDGAPYAVYCATLDRRKNHQVLYRAAQQMARNGLPGNFVFVGGMGNGVNDLLDSLRHDRTVRGRFAHVTRCNDDYLAAIYARAKFAVYPSLYEGWGLGVTEALAHGKPCLVASGSSLGEAGLGICRELHPLRTAEWVEALNEYFAEPPVVDVSIPTWAATGEALLEAVQR